jgi:CheY-like chemotaxis protein
MTLDSRVKPLRDSRAVGKSEELHTYCPGKGPMTLRTDRLPTTIPIVRPESATAPRKQERPLVLIIDEEQSARDLYGHWFITQGFEVMCAVGVLGLSWALKRDRPQLIVTELKARDLTLRDLVARLRCDQTTRCIPIIVVTASCDERALNGAKAAGAVAVLPKLTDFDLLRSWVSALCG